MNASDFEAKRRQRNYALALVLIAFVALVFAITIVKMKAQG